MMNPGFFLLIENTNGNSMKRISSALLWLIILTIIADPIDHNFTGDYQNQSNPPIYDEEENGKFVTLSSDSDDCDNGGAGCSGMVGLELDCCTDGEIFALVTFVVVFVGIPLYWIYRKLWKLSKKIFFDKSREEEVEIDYIEVNESLGRHLPVTEKELFEFRVKGIKKRRRREDMEENKKEPINVKEEFVLLSVFLFVIYLFWNNGV